MASPLVNLSSCTRANSSVLTVASCFKEAEPLTSKDSAEVVGPFQNVNKWDPLKRPQLLQVDPGRKFMGTVTKEMEKHKTNI